MYFLLTTVVLFALCWGAQSQSGIRKPAWTLGSRPLIVCTASNQQFGSLCDHGIFDSGSAPEGGWCPNTSDYGFCGYDVDVFRQVAANIGLVAGKDYVQVCFGDNGFQPLLNDLSGQNITASCDIGVSSITATVARLDQGIQFSGPTYRGALGIMVLASVDTSGKWAFLKPLHWSVWTALLLSSLIVPVIVVVLERMLSGRSYYRANKADLNVLFALKEATWHSLAHILSIDCFRVNSLPSRIVVLGYAFMVLICINTYTANLAAFLTVNSLNIGISSPSDLVGRAVATTPTYITALDQYHITGSANWGFDYLAMIAALKAGSVAAVVSDDTQLAARVAQDPSCQLYLLASRIAPFNIAFAFANNFGNKTFITQVSDELIALQESGELTQLQTMHSPPPDTCFSSVSGNSNTSQVHISSLWGLWIIMAVLVGVSIVAAVILMVVHARKQKKQLEENRYVQRFATLLSVRRSQSMQSTADSAPHYPQFGSSRFANSHSGDESDAKEQAANDKAAPATGGARSGRTLWQRSTQKLVPRPGAPLAPAAAAAAPGMPSLSSSVLVELGRVQEDAEPDADSAAAHGSNAVRDFLAQGADTAACNHIPPPAVDDGDAHRSLILQADALARRRADAAGQARQGAGSPRSTAPPAAATLPDGGGEEGALGSEGGRVLPLPPALTQDGASSAVPGRAADARQPPMRFASLGHDDGAQAESALSGDRALAMTRSLSARTRVGETGEEHATPDEAPTGPAVDLDIAASLEADDSAAPAGVDNDELQAVLREVAGLHERLRRLAARK